MLVQMNEVIAEQEQRCQAQANQGIQADFSA